MVAAGEVSHIHVDLLRDAASVARRTCTHHGQIVPTIIRETSGAMEGRERAGRAQRDAEDEARWRRERALLPKPEEWAPTQEELDAIKAEAARNLAAN